MFVSLLISLRAFVHTKIWHGEVSHYPIAQPSNVQAWNTNICRFVTIFSPLDENIWEWRNWGTRLTWKYGMVYSHPTWKNIDWMKRKYHIFLPQFSLSWDLLSLHCKSNQVHAWDYHFQLKLEGQQVRSGIFLFCLPLRSKSQTWKLSWLTWQVIR